MIIAAPRSGSAWAANWLSTDTTLCLHDVLFNYHYTTLDSIQISGKQLGVADTGIWAFPEFLKKHPARKVVFHRPQKEVNDALGAIGLPVIPDIEIKLKNITNANHYDWECLFDPIYADEIYEYLLEKPFDLERHKLLCQLNIQRDLGRIKPDPLITKRLINDLRTLKL